MAKQTTRASVTDPKTSRHGLIVVENDDSIAVVDDLIKLDKFCSESVKSKYLEMMEAEQRHRHQLETEGQNLLKQSHKRTYRENLFRLGLGWLLVAGFGYGIFLLIMADKNAWAGGMVVFELIFVIQLFVAGKDAYLSKRKDQGHQQK